MELRSFVEIVRYRELAHHRMFKLTKDDFCAQVDKVLTVGEFYEISADARIIFT